MSMSTNTEVGTTGGLTASTYDPFHLLSEVETEARLETTKAMPVKGGSLVQVSIERQSPDGGYAVAVALTFVPGVDVLRVVGGGFRLSQPHEVH